jgi:dihydrofolate synthase/folylpolyglutamate synthase
VFVDGAHNPESIRVLVSALSQVAPDRKAVFVFAVAEDKDWKTMLKRMAPRAAAIVLTESGNPRSVAAEKLEAPATRAGFRSVAVEADPVRALEVARETAGARGLVVATGSLYLVGALMSRFPGADAAG